MRIAANATSAELDNGIIRLQASLAGSDLAIQLAALDDRGAWIPILQRDGQTEMREALRAERPQQATMEVEAYGHSATLVVHGLAGGRARHVLQLSLRADSPWVDVSELLIVDERAADVAIDWFEAVWRFVD